MRLPLVLALTLSLATPAAAHASACAPVAVPGAAHVEQSCLDDLTTTGTDFFTDGRDPGDALVEWNNRVTQLTVSAKLALKLHYGRFPHRTIVEFLWPYHKQVYCDLTQRIYRTELDPAYQGPDAGYDYAARPRSVHRAVARISLLEGWLKGTQPPPSATIPRPTGTNPATGCSLG